MANQYYGDVGDVWKHLPLAALLEGERPERYGEANAGSAAYPALTTRRRPCDYWDFVERAPTSAVLAESTYFALLKAELDRGEAAARYPGSPYVAMSLLDRATTDYVFADTDGESIQSIADAATELGIAPTRLALVHGDGVAALTERLSQWGDETFVMVDPFEPLMRISNGVSSIELVCNLATRGIKTLLWYAISLEKRDEHDQVRSALEVGLTGRLSSPYWIGELRLSEKIGTDAGLLGCGLMAANIGPSSLQRCEALGAALAASLPSASFEVTTVASAMR